MIVSESVSGRAYQEYVNPQWVALLNLDEAQTGMYRTGTFLAAHQLDVQPDMVVLAMRLFRKRNILTQICENNFMVLKVVPPPVVVSEEQLDEFVEAIASVVKLADTSAAFWTEAPGLAKRAVNI